MIKSNKGFTLIELLVVVLIVGILAAMAMPAYFRAVERSRMAEAEQLMGNVVQAQQRRFLNSNSYSLKWNALDVAPKGAGAISTFCTKGTQAEYSGTAYTGCDGGNGFAIVIAGTQPGEDAIVTAYRVNNNQYQYNLSRPYDSNAVTCTAVSDDAEMLCADFCGVDSITDKTCTRGNSTNPARS